MSDLASLDKLIALHLDGELSHGQCAELAQFLEKSAEARRRFWREIHLHHAVADLCDRHWGDISLSSEPDWITPYEQELKQAALDHGSGKTQTINPRQLLSLTGYLLGEALTSRMAYKAYGVAAAVLVAVTLFLVFRGGEDDKPAEPLAGQAPATILQPDQPHAAPALAVVATLTAEHGAAWDRRPGQDLFAGQRFTLTRGYAEITTERGAVAILEAPATVEMFDSDNAIRLHAGKLVGICETPTSKGFLVRTPHIDITDLGTEFGVEVDPVEKSFVAVFRGSVKVSTPPFIASRSSQTQRLNAGWALVASSSGEFRSEPHPIKQNSPRFVRSIKDAKTPGHDYRAAVLASKPLVYWRFDIDQGGIPNEAGDPALNGQPIGAVRYQQGLFGSAFVGPGPSSDTFVGITSDKPLTLGATDAYTVEAWVYPESRHHGRVVGIDVLGQEATGIKAMFAMELTTDTGIPHGKLDDTPFTVRFNHRNPPSGRTIDGADLFSAEPYPTGRWVHLVAVKDAGMMRLYLDGKLVNEQADSQAAESRDALRVVLGAHPKLLNTQGELRADDVRPFHGLIDELAIYPTALPESAIQNHYLLGRQKFDAP